MKALVLFSGMGDSGRRARPGRPLPHAHSPAEVLDLPRRLARDSPTALRDVAADLFAAE